MPIDLFRWFRPTRLTDPQKELLRALLEGWTLKSHRTLDGEKAYRLHTLTGEMKEVAAGVVDGLMEARFLQSNQKFPAATYLLTDRGDSVARRLTLSTGSPLTARRFFVNDRAE